jgi:hypothetical protein
MPAEELPEKPGDVDVLIGAFFGDGSRRGYKELESIVSHCPAHGKPKQFFALDNLKKVEQLRKIVHMATHISGFCQACLYEVTSGQQSIIPRDAQIMR